MGFSDRTTAVLQAADRRISSSRPESPTQRFEACLHAVQALAPVDSFYGGWFIEPGVLSVEYVTDRGVPHGGDVIPFGPRGLSAHLINTGRTYLWRHDDGHLIHLGVKFGALDEASRDAVVTPMLAANGSVLGILAALSYRAGAFDAEVVAALGWLATAVAISQDHHASLTQRLDLEAIYPDSPRDQAAEQVLLSLAQDLTQLDHQLRVVAGRCQDATLDDARAVVQHAQRQLTAASRPGLRPSTHHDLRLLTSREREIVEHLLTHGSMTNRQLATRLGISEFTVKGHMTRILAKLQVGSRAELLRPAPELSTSRS
ncbi:LuxR C-terminal-related transcriptional regulator [Microlunatus soli]|uniref:Regulatory protein, luxR family n=1 Tax=Microlunatus soli TaxID=630515 RepID=A0A1H1UYY9_9ACTN|nr:LuxR C-terminal-related transcriptional regulator [Microlunatus soli]SDS77600.1 regulatory protein, luxR family [Microlunatus soli]